MDFTIGVEENITLRKTNINSRDERIRSSLFEILLPHVVDLKRLDIQFGVTPSAAPVYLVDSGTEISDYKSREVCRKTWSRVSVARLHD